MIKEVDDCPYWQELTLECGMTKGGVYLPMPEHIEMFCGSPEFIQCHQYIRGCEQLREAARKYGYLLAESRRRYRRVQERLALKLFDIAEDGAAGRELCEDSCTVDLSLGGLRCEVDKEIPVNRKLVFRFGEEFSSPFWSGEGEVRWTQKIDDTTKYQAGLVFTDSKTFQAIGHHIGLPGVPSM